MQKLNTVPEKLELIIQIFTIVFDKKKITSDLFILFLQMNGLLESFNLVEL